MRRFSGNLNHNSLVSYLDYATKVKTDPSSYIFQGTLYEYSVAERLQEALGTKGLQVCGGAFDGGLDITGKWNIDHFIQDPELAVKNTPTKASLFDGSSIKPYIHRLYHTKNDMLTRKRTTNFDILAQCKAFGNIKIAGRLVREVSGTYEYNVLERNRWKTVMFMCSPTLMTADGIKMLNALKFPAFHVRIQKLQCKAGADPYDIKSYEGGLIENFYPNAYANSLFSGLDMETQLKKKQFQQLPILKLTDLEANDTGSR